MTEPCNVAGPEAETDNTGRTVPTVHASHHTKGFDPGSLDSAVTDLRRVVLVVDDEPTVRLLLTEVLDDLQCASLEAVDGASGLSIVRSTAAIDLMITDVGLPGGMDGRNLAAAARAARPGLAILFITGYPETAALVDGALEAKTMVLTKPFSLDDLISRIKVLLA